MPVPIDPFGYQNQMDDNQDDAETKASPVIACVNDPSLKSAHLPLPEEERQKFAFTFHVFLHRFRVVKRREETKAVLENIKREKVCSGSNSGKCKNPGKRVSE